MLPVEVVEDPLDHRRVLDAGDDPDLSTTGRTGLDVDVEDPLQALRPEPAPDLIRGHRCAAFGGRLWLIRSLGLPALTSLGGGHQGAVFAVGRKDAVEAGEVDSRLWYQGCQSGDEVQRLTKSPGAILNSRRLARRVEGRMPGIKMTWVVPSRYGVFSR